jgi:DNA-binding transcriptional regulator LsrR (DeoR family)
VADHNTALLTAVARMYYLDGMGQNEIAVMYGISRSTVSRMLTEARVRGIVRITVDDFEPTDADLEARLRDAFGLLHVAVIRGMGGSGAHLRRTIGHFAAPQVASWLAESQVVGIAGGRTIADVVQTIQPQPPMRHLRVVPLMGTVGASPSAVDASEISRAVARRYDGHLHTVNAPIFVQEATAQRLFLSHSQIQAVWRLFDTMDRALVGIGTLEDSVFVERQVLSRSDLQDLRRTGAVGEMCGRFFDEHGNECDSPFRDRVISVDLDRLRACGDVIAITSGAKRATALAAAIRGGLIRSLVIDDTGAAALLQGAPSTLALAGETR